MPGMIKSRVFVLTHVAAGIILPLQTLIVLDNADNMNVDLDFDLEKQQ
jgi:hypothetical protein